VNPNGGSVRALTTHRTARRVASALVVLGVMLAVALTAPSLAPALVDGEPPTANISVDPNPANIGEVIEFDGSGSTSDTGGSITLYEWDLDNDGTFEQTGPSASIVTGSFGSAGDHQVTLRVWDNDPDLDGDGPLGPEPDTETATVHVNFPPTANFIYEPSSPDVGDAITFASTSSDEHPGEDGSIASAVWDLNGNGTFGEVTPGVIDEQGATVTHSFGSTGNQAVTLRVTDDDGATSELTRTVSVGSTQPVPQPGEPNPQPGPPTTDNRSPDASFRVSPRSPTAGDEVDLISTSSDPDGSIASYQWDLDSDGQFDDGAGAVITRVFPKGEVEVGLRVVDSQGAADVATKTITVQRRSVSLLSPFPIVRLAGALMPSGKTKIKKLTVKAPKGAEVDVRCKGKSCPFAHEERSAKAASLGS
jgi:PKD domain